MPDTSLNSFVESKIIPAMKKLNYTIYENGNINIVGIRNKVRQVDIYNDSIFSFWKEGGLWKCTKYVITTEPGEVGLLDPSNSKGTAILVPGQYVDVYSIDIHARGKKSEHEALCQRNGVVKVYRDNDRDREYDYNSKTIDSGYFGINIHRSTLTSEANQKVGYSSEGCNVFAHRADFEAFLENVKKFKSLNNNKYTYTLLDESQL